MRDADGHIQAEAVAIAGDLSIRELAPDVLRIAKKGFADVRVKALVALIRLDREAAVSTIDRFVNEGTTRGQKDVSGRHGAPGRRHELFLPEDAPQTTATKRCDRWPSASSATTWRTSGYLDLFRTVLNGGDVPDEVLKVIGEKRLKGFKDVLLRMLTDPLQPLWTRYHALAALAVFRDASLFPIFADCLKDKNNLIKIGGLKALSAIGEKRAIPRIRPFTKSIDEDVRAAAVIALERLSRAEDLC